MFFFIILESFVFWKNERVIKGNMNMKIVFMFILIFFYLVVYCSCMLFFLALLTFLYDFKF